MLRIPLLVHQPVLLEHGLNLKKTEKQKRLHIKKKINKYNKSQTFANI